MIAFDFAYYRPTSVAEALDLYRQVQAQGKRPLYYAGGTEIISMARMAQITADAVIDLKGIPDCRTLESRDGQVIVGAAVHLTQLEAAGLFPLLAAHSQRVADRTSRNRITVGGNIAGKTVYREIVLPLLVCDSEVIVAGYGGLTAVSIHDVFDQQLRLQDGEFIVQLRTAAADTNVPFASLKKTRLSPIDYPLVSLAAINKDGRIRIALSGVCGYPFRSKQIEEGLNDRNGSIPDRIDYAIAHLPDPILDDWRASRDYRKFVLERALYEALRLLEGGTQS